MKLGSFLGQLAEGRMAEAQLTYAGEIAGHAIQPLTVTFLRGLLGVILEENVTDVNAPYLARQRGLRVVEAKTPVSENYASLLTAELVTDRGRWQVAGTLFHRREPRIVQVDGFDLEAHAAGWMVVLSNDDVPGVIGRIGTLFGAHPRRHPVRRRRLTPHHGHRTGRRRRRRTPDRRRLAGPGTGSRGSRPELCRADQWAGHTHLRPGPGA